MRRFEFIEGGSSKFWEIALAGDAVTVRYGRIGTQGQAQTKAHASAAKAQTEHDKLIREKTGKGYVEVSVAGVPAVPVAAPTRATAPAPAPTPTTNNQQPTTNNQQPTTNNQEPASNRPPIAVPVSPLFQ